MILFTPAFCWLLSAVLFALAFVQVERVYQAFSRARWRQARVLAGWGLVALVAGSVLAGVEIVARALGAL